jgi:hypothetical protein
MQKHLKSRGSGLQKVSQAGNVGDRKIFCMNLMCEVGFSYLVYLLLNGFLIFFVVEKITFLSYPELRLRLRSDLKPQVV